MKSGHWVAISCRWPNIEKGTGKFEIHARYI